MSIEALNCGNAFSAEATTFSAIAVIVILPPAFSAFGSKAFAQLFQFGDIRLIELRNVRNHIPRQRQMLGCLAPHCA